MSTHAVELPASTTPATSPVAYADPLHCIELAFADVRRGVASHVYRPPDEEPEWEPSLFAKARNWIMNRSAWHDAPVDEIRVEVSHAGHIYHQRRHIWLGMEARLIRVDIADPHLVQAAMSALRANLPQGEEPDRVVSDSGLTTLTCYWFKGTSCPSGLRSRTT